MLRSSSWFCLVPGARLVRLCPLRGRRDQLVRQHQLCPAHLSEGQSNDFLVLDDLQQDLLTFDPTQPAAKTLAALLGDRHVDPCLEARPAPKLLQTRQGTVEAGGGDLQAVGAGDRILHVQHRRDAGAEVGAIVDRHAAVRALRHDLQRPPATFSGKLNPNDLETQIDYSRRDQALDFGCLTLARPRRLLRRSCGLVSRIMHYDANSRPRLANAPATGRNKKGGPMAHHSEMARPERKIQPRPYGTTSPYA